MTKEDICRIAGVTVDKLENGDETITLSGDNVDSLPDGLNIYALILVNCPSLKNLPDDLRINYLHIQDCPNLKSLPVNLIVQYLYLINSDIETIPKKSLCWASLVLVNCPNIKTIPQSCIGYAQMLYIENCPNIVELPDIKYVHGQLELYSTNIKSLPKNLQIGDELCLVNSCIAEIPDGVRIGGDIYLYGNKVMKKLPDNLIVNGNLTISDTLIEKLPENLIVKGDLDIRETLIKELPQNLIVGGNIKGNDYLSDFSQVRKDVPLDISERIWKDTDYIKIDGELYRKMEEKGDYIKIMNSLLDIYRLQFMSDEIHEDSIFYAVRDKDNPYSYHITSTLE